MDINAIFGKNTNNKEVVSTLNYAPDDSVVYEVKPVGDATTGLAIVNDMGELVQIECKRFSKENKRFYVFGESLYPSVTTILDVYPKQHLKRWYGTVGYNEAEADKNEAGKKGNRVHNALEKWLMGFPVVFNNPDYPAYNKTQIEAILHNNGAVIYSEEEWIQVLRYAEAIKRFNVDPRKVITEFTVVSHKYKFAGTLDNVFWIEAGVYDVAGSKPIVLKESGYYICDIKTSRHFSETFYMQLSAYYVAFLEMNPRFKDQFKGGIIFCTNQGMVKTGIEGFRAFFATMDELKEYFRIFQIAHELWKADNKRLSLTKENKPLPTISVWEKRKKENDSQSSFH